MVFPSDTEVPDGGAPQPALCPSLPADPKALEETDRQDTTPLAGSISTKGWGARHTLAFLGSLGITVMYTIRISLSVAIVAMVTTTPLNSSNATNGSADVCPPPDDYDPQETYQGGCFPAMNTLLATWFPPAERSKYTTLVMTGQNVGTVIAMPVTGWLSSSEELGGWRTAFYVFGTSGLVWCIAWFLLVHDRPEHHPRISDAELQYLLSYKEVMKDAKVVPLPWYDVLTSPYVWLVTLASVGDTLGFYTIITELPTYLTNIQHFDMNSTGVLSALPYALAWVISLFWGFLVEKLASSGAMTILQIRNMSMAISYYLPTLCLVGMCFIGCNGVLAMVLLCLAVGLATPNMAGYLCAHQDLAPNFAGTLMGFTNTFGSLMGVVAPALTGAITYNNQTLAAWREVFLISAGTYVVTCTIYIAFMTADVQPWNDPKKTRAR
ncbi:putative inorganic phosphate cotransporter isoform X2 [Penaeus chinensis]|uniref:putative inorganic phosphate cotransporter isoform X2 n=1 Tax=Penaeus chinensis TaxID=139456 RepID=UPI001FB6FCCC|nr:putative inorganic phosphate cotransporter isoform X2 [Penaeus chinensis]